MREQNLCLKRKMAQNMVEGGTGSSPYFRFLSYQPIFCGPITYILGWVKYAWIIYHMTSYIERPDIAKLENKISDWICFLEIFTLLEYSKHHKSFKVNYKCRLNI